VPIAIGANIADFIVGLAGRSSFSSRLDYETGVICSQLLKWHAFGAPRMTEAPVDGLGVAHKIIV
jgi:hypothetical protein